MKKKWPSIEWMAEEVGINLRDYSENNETRRLLQRLVYLLQRSGFPLDYTYEAYRSGPYAQHGNMEVSAYLEKTKKESLREEEKEALRNSKSFKLLEAIGKNESNSFIDIVVIMDFVLQENPMYDDQTLLDIINQSTLYHGEIEQIALGRKIINEYLSL